MHVPPSSTRSVTASLTFSFGVEHHAEPEQGALGSVGAVTVAVTVTVTGSGVSSGSSLSSCSSCQTTQA